MNRKQLTVNEVANYCGVSFLAVRRWIQEGLLPAGQIPGRPDYLIPVEDFLSYLRNNAMPVPKDLLVMGHRVLIVDDDELITRLIEIHLKKAGFETFVARDGFIGGASLESFRPTLMTLDIRMPGLDGMEVLKFIRGKEHFNDTKILVVSSLPPEKLEEAVRAGANDFLGKPFEPEILVAKVYALAGVPPA
jgi:excisionase family DNA binding protein